MANRLTISELQTAPEFLVLNPRQREFVLEYLKDGDSGRAARIVYPNHRQPAIAGLTMLSRARVKTCLDKFFGSEPADRVLADLEKVLKQHIRANGKLREKGIDDPQLQELLRDYLRLGGTSLELRGLIARGRAK